MIGLTPAEGSLYKYSHIVGTGGIGSGLLFNLKGDHTLGRNESRLGDLSPSKDYCKMHIIMHYISILLNANPSGTFRAFPIGKVGNDDIGKRLIDDMQRAGMETEKVSIEDGHSTLFSVCFQYPDKSGGNITTANSACNLVSSENIDLFFQDFLLKGEDELILAAPEVPVDARIRLLQIGRSRGSFNVSSVLSSETEEFIEKGGLELTDLLAINIDEARMFAGIKDEDTESKTIVDKCINKITALNPKIMLVITDGSKGSYSYKDNYVEYTPSLPATVASTAGAGDAFLSGTVSGLSCGLPFFKGSSDNYFSETPAKSAVELGTMLASLSVTSADTIHQAADARLIYEMGIVKGISYSDSFLKLFSNVVARSNSYEVK